MGITDKFLVRKKITGTIFLCPGKETLTDHVEEVPGPDKDLYLLSGRDQLEQKPQVSKHPPGLVF